MNQGMEFAYLNRGQNLEIGRTKLMSAERVAAIGAVGRRRRQRGGRLLRRVDRKAAALRFGFFSLLLGYAAITAALYSSRWSDGDGAIFPTVTIFAAPRPFSFAGGRPDLVGARQELAARSWVSLGDEVAVVLFGRDPSISFLASIIGPRVAVESAIDFTFMGTPFFHCMVARALNASSAISLVIDPETILLPNFLTALHCAHKLNGDWFLVSMAPSISNFPFHINDTRKQWLKEDGTIIAVEKLQEYVDQKLQWSSCTKRILMAWNKGEASLLAGILPPFLYGKDFHNEWLLHQVLASNFRSVIDVTYIASAFYPEKLPHYFKNKISIDSANSGWEENGNHYLATLYGSLFSELHGIVSTHFKLIKCSCKHAFLDSMQNVAFYAERTKVHPLGLKLVPYQEIARASFVRRTLNLWVQKKWAHCIQHIHILESQCSLMHLYSNYNRKPKPLFSPFTLESLLQTTKDKDETVVVAVAGDNYKDMLMSWVCRLRHLAIPNFIVCALDAESYEFALLLGLPVFRDPLAPNNISFDDCHFGTVCFQRVTKVKSRLVLQILKLGCNVLLSDVDVYWFSNPLPLLQSFGQAKLIAQSDEYNETGPINLPHRLNSGFYFARADRSTITAIEKVVKHASTSGLSEQPSFYDILCGEDGINRVDDNHCHEPDSNLTVHFLDRNLFPNGAYKGLWEKRNVRSACKKQGCLILHNNWINGRKRKLERQVHSGLWDYDPTMRIGPRAVDPRSLFCQFVHAGGDRRRFLSPPGFQSASSNLSNSSSRKDNGFGTPADLQSGSGAPPPALMRGRRADDANMKDRRRRGGGGKFPRSPSAPSLHLTLFLLCCLLLSAVAFSAFRLFGVFFRVRPVLLPTWRNPTLNAFSGDYPNLRRSPSFHSSPAGFVVEAAVSFPDEVLLFLKPKSIAAGTKLRCLYFLSPSGESQLSLPPVSSSVSGDFIRCPLPPKTDAFNMSLSQTSLPQLPPLLPLRWDIVAYAAVLDPVDNSTVVFAKGHNLRPARLSNPSSFECIFAWDFFHPKYSLSSEAISAAQEIFRCRTPLSVFHRLGHHPTSKSPFVSVRFKAHGSFPLPSIARHDPLFPRLLNHRRKDHRMCVCTMLRNQARFLREWIIYHTHIGVERWFIYDNNSDDDIEQVVKWLSSNWKVKISLLEWPWVKTQEAGFAHCAMRARASCDWVGFIDVDEFIFFPSATIKLQDVLSNYSRMPWIGELRTACHSFGPSGRKTAPPEGVTAGYTCRIAPPERHKSIIRPEALNPSLINIVHHFHLKDGMKYVNMDARTMVINHYKYQAWEVFKEKFFRRVATYVVDWREEENVGSKDRAPGLGTKAVRPSDWATRFCEVNDTGLRDRVLKKILLQ
ncbi:UPF0392 protein [Apostasia shenzhenica]|uniref:Glycosyltransferase n=1 Tax=Apostasia shenzhenica TaxID=1088818 RepID=A0A2I0AXF4_9ASPA|nr:UPF0392 protein [Apostasia shenzhenica]